MNTWLLLGVYSLTETVNTQTRSYIKGPMVLTTVLAAGLASFMLCSFSVCVGVCVWVCVSLIKIYSAYRESPRLKLAT